MKLIYLANIRIPNERAHGLQVMKMCEAFSLGGYEVELWASQIDQPKDIFAYYGITRNFTIKNLRGFDDPAIGKLNYWSNLISFMVLANFYLFWLKLFAKKKVIVYTRGEPILFLNFIAKFVWPVFWETHAKPSRLLPKYLHSANNCAGVVTVTDFYRRELSDVYKLKSKVLWAPDGVTLDEMDIGLSQTEVRKDLGLPLDKKIVLYTGSFYVYDYKGLDILLEAAEKLPADYLTVLVGGTKPEIKKIEAEKPMEGILLVPRVPHTGIAKYLCAADVLVLPNKKGDETSEKYTSPMKLFEYMAARRPIVCSDVGSLREILDDSTAYIFKANDALDLVRAVVESLSPSGGAPSRVERAFELSKLYTWQKRARHISDFISEQLETR